MCTQSAVTLDAVTSTGPGSAVDLGRNYAHHTVIVSATGSPNVQVYLEFSHDGSTWATQSSVSGSSFPLQVHSDRVARYVRANLGSLSGGSSPTVTATVASA